jgi:hypothetical protein
MGEACGTYGARQGDYRVLVETPDGRRLLGIYRLRWKDNIKMDLQIVGWGMNWIDVAWIRKGGVLL